MTISLSAGSGNDFSLISLTFQKFNKLLAYVYTQKDLPPFVTLFDQLVEVLFHVLKYEEERLVLSDDLFEFDDVLMAQLLQRLKEGNHHPL